MRARRCAIAALGATAVFVTTSAAIAQTNPLPAPKGLFAQTPPSSQYRLPQFDPKALRERGRAMQSLSERDRPTVVCGMTVIPAHPEVDPKAVKKAPDDKKFTMRSVRPQSCVADADQPTPPPAAPGEPVR
jgi:hypothetical protein